MAQLVETIPDASQGPTYLHHEYHHTGCPIRLPSEKYNFHLLIFMWKMSIVIDLTDRYVLDSISSHI